MVDLDVGGEGDVDEKLGVCVGFEMEDGIGGVEDGFELGGGVRVETLGLVELEDGVERGVRGRVHYNR